MELQVDAVLEAHLRSGVWETDVKSAEALLRLIRASRSTVERIVREAGDISPPKGEIH